MERQKVVLDPAIAAIVAEGGERQRKRRRTKVQRAQAERDAKRRRMTLELDPHVAQIGPYVELHLILGCHVVSPCPIVGDLGCPEIVPLATAIQGGRDRHARTKRTLGRAEIDRIAVLRHRRRVEPALGHQVDRRFEPIGRGVRGDPAHHGGGGDERGGLPLVHPLERCRVNGLLLGLEVHGLAGHERRVAARPGELADRPDLLRVRQPLVARDHAEGKAEQRVGREDGHPLADRLVQRRAPAPDVVVVHRGQIIVYERKGVHELGRARRRQRQRLVAGGGLARRQAEHRAQAFAGRGKRVAHAARNDFWNIGAGRQERRQRLLDEATLLVEAPLVHRVHLSVPGETVRSRSAGPCRT